MVNPSPIRVTIGIQARSTSTRLPNKVCADILGKPLLNHVIDSCLDAAGLVNLWCKKEGIFTHVSLCVPDSDPLADRYGDSLDVVTGPEFDVLARYLKLSEFFDSKFLVRITSDCGLIPSYVITKHINVALKNKYDYVSNVDERCRTAPDGYDCEVISSRLLDYVARHAESLEDKEHVTTFIRRSIWDESLPGWAACAAVIGHYDHSDLKISVNTQEDLDRITLEKKRVDDKLELARRAYGKNVYRL